MSASKLAVERENLGGRFAGQITQPGRRMRDPRRGNRMSSFTENPAEPVHILPYDDLLESTVPRD